MLHICTSCNQTNLEFKDSEKNSTQHQSDIERLIGDSHTDDLRREAAAAAEESAQALVVVSDALRLEAAGKTAAEQRADAAERGREDAIARSLQLH